MKRIKGLLTAQLTQFATINPMPIICWVSPTTKPRCFAGAISVYKDRHSIIIHDGE